MGGAKPQGVWGQESPNGVQGRSPVRGSAAELSVGLFSSTQPNPNHQITDPTQPIPTAR